jgi:hypothetical protein
MNLFKTTALLCTAFIILTGCSSQKSSSKEANGASNSQPILYQNKNVGLTLYQTDQWKKTSNETNSKETNIVFKEKKLQAIVTVLSAKNSISSIKKDLLKSVISPKTLSESDTSLDFESGTKENMRITSVFKKKNNHIYLFSFVTPANQYNSEKSMEQAFLDKVSIN